MAHINNNQALMIGADPELLVIDPSNNQVARAGYTFNGTHGNMSQDGGDSYTAEIRPAPGSPRQVTENIGHILRNSLRPGGTYADMLLVSGGGASYGKAVGGHIHFNVHFGTPNQNRSEESYIADKIRMLKTLDQFIGIPLKAMPGAARAGTSYGALSAERGKDYGFEYRTPPSWLPDPAFTESVLSVAYLLMDRMVKDSTFVKQETATFEDFRNLIPATGPFRRHWENQIESFLDFVFGGFQLDTLDMRERWNAPALIEWKRGAVMLNLLGSFQEKINAAKAIAEAARIAREAEDRARRERDRLAMEERNRLEAERRALLEAATAGRAAILAHENQIFAALGAPVGLSSTTKIRTRSFGANVFIHTSVQLDPNRYYNRTEVVEHRTVALKVGALRIIEGDGSYGWHNFRLLSNRTNHRRPWRTSSISQRENTIYISNDLQPLVRRTRSSAFKIRFVNIQNNGQPTPRTVFFTKGQGWDINAVLDLFRTSTKPRVPDGFYAYETPVAVVAAPVREATLAPA